MEVFVAYDQHTSITSALDWTALDWATNLRRPPVSFRGRVKEPVLLRQLLLALQGVILGDFRWMSEQEWLYTLDPVITVHPDQLFFEAFSSDQSSYARLSAPLDAFEVEGSAACGTTNIDFTWSLREALGNLRSSRRTWFNVGAGGFGVQTSGGEGRAHFERKVDVPQGWLKGFLQVQGSLTMPAFTFDVRPVDLINAIAFFQENKPPRPPHALRWEFAPGGPISLVLEPWEERTLLQGTRYEGYTRSVRLWGRRRLALLQTVLPYAQRVTVGILGRSLPHWYICHCGPFQFCLALSGWTENDWSAGMALDLLAPQVELAEATLETVYACLVERLAASRDEIAAATRLLAPAVEAALFRLCRAGRVMFDPTTGQYRLRELFAEPVNVDELFVPDPRLDLARRLVEDDHVSIENVTPPGSGSAGRPETRATATVFDQGSTYSVVASVDNEERLRFGRCGCPFFQTNLMSRGPCEHILAVRLALDARLHEQDGQAIIMSSTQGQSG